MEETSPFTQNERTKLDTDLTRNKFFKACGLKDQNGKAIDRKQKLKIWDELVLFAPELFIQLSAKYHFIHVLPEENIPAFKKRLWAEKGLILAKSQRPKLDTDLLISNFVHSWHLRDKNGKAPTIQDRINLWNTFRNSHQELFVTASTTGFSALALPQENISAFQQWLIEEKGITASKTRKSQRKVLETDLTNLQFYTHWILTNENGKSVPGPIRTSLWNEFKSSKHKDLFIMVPSHGKTSFILPQENIHFFKDWLLQKKHIIAQEPLKSVRAKLNTDITKSQFSTSWLIMSEKGKVLNYETKIALFEEVKSKNPNLFVCVSSAHPVIVLPQENIPAFQQWLIKQKGLIAQKPLEPLRQLLKTDLTKNNFCRSWFVRDKNNDPIWNHKTKSLLFEECLLNQQNLFIPVKHGKSKTYKQYVLPQENIPAFQQWLLTAKGIIASETKILNDTLSLRQKLETDLSTTQFRYWHLNGLDGQSIKGTKAKSALFKEFKSLNRNKFFIYAFSGNNRTYVLPEENIPALERWLLTEKGIIASKTKFPKKPAPHVRQRTETDITQTSFCAGWRLFTSDGKKLSYKQKSQLWNTIKKQENNGLLVQVQYAFVLPKENIPAFKQKLYQIGGFTVYQKGESIPRKTKAPKTTADKPSRPKKQCVQGRQIEQTDTIKAQFIYQWKLKRGDGSFFVADHGLKSQLWQTLEKQKDQKILILSYFGASKQYVLPRENIPAFKQWLYKTNNLIASIPDEQQLRDNKTILPLSKNQNNGR